MQPSQHVANNGNYFGWVGAVGPYHHEGYGAHQRLSCLSSKGCRRRRQLHYITPTSIHLDRDWFKGHTVFGAVPHVKHLVLIKARQYDTSTLPATCRCQPFLKMKLPSSALPLDTSPFQNDPIDDTFLTTLSCTWAELTRDEHKKGNDT